jgi:hypothetical protein
MDKHSNLLRKSVNYGRKKFNSTGYSLLRSWASSGKEMFNDPDTCWAAKLSGPPTIGIRPTVAPG